MFLVDSLPVQEIGGDIRTVKSGPLDATEGLADVSVSEAWGAELEGRLDRALAGERGRPWADVRADMRASITHRKAR